jgi:hypothetical protein
VFCPGPKLRNRGRYYRGTLLETASVMGRPLVGAISGGIAAEMYGGSFIKESKRGAISATYALLFNESLHRARHVISAAEGATNGEEWMGTPWEVMDCSHFVNQAYEDALKPLRGASEASGAQSA